MMSQFNDENVQATNDDACSCKASAVKLGYWTDNYIHFFARQTDHKPPEINRGYYVRVKAVDSLISQFHKLTNGVFQVVNLGAGYDTRFWNLSDLHETPVRWVEVDFETIVRKKIHIIKTKKLLSEKLFKDNAIIEPSVIHSPSGFHLISANLRDLESLEKQILNECGVDPAIPTLFIAECVLVYINGDESTALLKWITNTFSDCFFINYEQVNLMDRFGEVMLKNLESRGCPLLGSQHCKSKQSQIDRFKNSGWDKAACFEMLEIFKAMPLDLIKKLESIEFLDDYEMLAQLFSHYCVVYSYKNTSNNLTFSDIQLNH